VRIFQQAEDRSTARQEIETHYNLTPIQSDVIASMTLSQVTRLDANKYAKEQTDLQTRIAELERLLSDRKALITLLKKEMQQLIKQFGDERRTTIDIEGQIHAPIEMVERLHEREPLLIVFTRNGTIKTLPADSYKPKGKNTIYVPVRGDEQLRQLIPATSQDYLLCISSSGRVYQIATHRVPTGTRSAKGEPIANLLELAPGEEIVTLLPVDIYDEDRYLVTFSKLGKVKKSPLSEYKTADIDGVQDMKLTEGDTVATALISHGTGDYLVTTNTAQTLRFSDDQLRAQGRFGQGVAAISLTKGALVQSASYLDNERVTPLDTTSLLIVTSAGMTKKVLVSEFAVKGRATVGLLAIELQQSDSLLLTTLVKDDDTVLFVSSGENGEKGERTTVMRAGAVKTFARGHKGSRIVGGRIVGVVVLA
jgi:DNA gyrase subunit A